MSPSLGVDVRDDRNVHVDGQRRIPCAGAVIIDGPAGARRLLLIRRGRPPAQGRWSVPGGRCLPGEPPAECCVREAREETGLDVSVMAPAGQVERDAPDGSVYVIDDFVCRLEGGTLRAGDDADDAAWFSRAQLVELPLTSGLTAALTEWGLLPD
jgi:ADP-ribose pyrophosphatase YjhB (NUDIX family)